MVHSDRNGFREIQGQGYNLYKFERGTYIAQNTINEG